MIPASKKINMRNAKLEGIEPVTMMKIVTHAYH